MNKMVEASVEIVAQAYAFRQLVAHLQTRTDVQNIELMILSGFCRNCLSKWHHVGAAKAGWALSYEDSCERVYGMSYKEWKQTHQSKATDEQLKRLEETKASHAKHQEAPAVVPAVASSPAPTTTTIQPGPLPPPPSASAGMSNVCCVPEDELVHPAALGAPVPPLIAAPPPSTEVEVRLGILTVSDRASRGVYADGSGPEVARIMQDFAAKGDSRWRLTLARKAVVGDEDAEYTSPYVIEPTISTDASPLLFWL